MKEIINGLILQARAASNLKTPTGEATAKILRELVKLLMKYEDNAEANGLVAEFARELVILKDK